MAPVNVSARLKRLESKQHSDFAEIKRLIAAGVYYDQLTDKQKSDYEEYKCSWGNVADDVATAKLDTMFFDIPSAVAFHFQLSERKPAITSEELQERIDEIENFIKEKKAEEWKE